MKLRDLRRCIRRLIIEGDEEHYDEMTVESHLVDLEAGLEIMITPEEFEELKSFCEYEQIDHVFSSKEYGNGVAVKISDRRL
tara:strand:- start:579 stop:824 length:246 start_codon:yes stop_codon:yes gene_type:complete